MGEKFSNRILTTITQKVTKSCRFKGYAIFIIFIMKCVIIEEANLSDYRCQQRLIQVGNLDKSFMSREREREENERQGTRN